MPFVLTAALKSTSRLQAIRRTAFRSVLLTAVCFKRRPASQAARTSAAGVLTRRPQRQRQLNDFAGRKNEPPSNRRIQGLVPIRFDYVTGPKFQLKRRVCVSAHCCASFEDFTEREMQNCSAFLLEFMKASLGPAVALLAAAVAWGQWQTAKQRMLLDLFDRRLKVFEAIERAIGPVNRDAEVTEEQLKDLLTARAGARFLFADDVNESLATLQKDFAFLLAFGGEIAPDYPNREQLIAQKYETLQRVMEYPSSSMALFRPYVRFTQKQRQPWQR
jgi:hypothetical protein